MNADADAGAPIAYTALERDTPVLSADGVELGVVERVVENAREHIFDGIVLRAAGGADGLRWVDAPEVARIFERRVELAVSAEEAETLVGPYEPGAPEFRANVKAGRLGRFFGGGWRRS